MRPPSDVPRGQAGFSLIELLVVVLLVGALAAIVIREFLDQRGKAHDGSAKQPPTTSRSRPRRTRPSTAAAMRA